MTSKPLARRKFVAISAAAAGLGLLPWNARTSAASPLLIEWTGLWLGSVASIRLYHQDRSAGEQLLRRALAEARRLETVFTLYRHDSLLCELNRSSALAAPPAELVELLGICDRAWSTTGGLFDPTVQPLWQCYLEHYSNSGPQPGPLPPESLARALGNIGWRRVRFNRDRIVLEPGMALTLNGVAQGYMTDHVVELLRAGGLDSCLVDMGEIRSLGMKPDGMPWQIAIDGPTKRPLGAAETLGKAVATSAADGFAFTADGQSNHLFNPITGHCAAPGRTITVVAPTAAEADALSTAFALMDDAGIATVLPHVRDVRVHLSTRVTTGEITTADHRL